MKIPKNQPSIAAKNFFNSTIDHMCYLASRWMDEREFEDINDYKKSIQDKATPFGVTITKMKKRPFGCEFTTNDTEDSRTFRYIVRMDGRVGFHRIIK